ncbi:hypothetical protein [Mycobacterium sp. DL440]|uniref:hypothetical protein n=1 Tax=Mycobacterium sp. DL440 TaxID=2675523 RepID=UPI001FB91C79|nr:hypothetical protein [Mycobacterium sp. DL440]
MPVDDRRPKVMLGIADSASEAPGCDAFIGALISLGSLLRRYLGKLDGRQLVVAISLPRRDYAAALVGAGWMLSAPAPNLTEPITTFRSTEQGAFLRAVTHDKVVSGRFTSLNESRTPARVITGGRTLVLSSVEAVAEIPGICESVIGDVPTPGYLAQLTAAVDTWRQRIASPPTDLAIVGTTKWLLDDFAALIGSSSAADDIAPLSNYVLPNVPKAATWATTVISSARLREIDPIPPDCLAVILDRYGAIKYLDEITVPIVVCIIDRSVADDSAAELVVQARVANSQPVDVSAFRWQSPPGVEALAFTVAL